MDTRPRAAICGSRKRISGANGAGTLYIITKNRVTDDQLPYKTIISALRDRILRPVALLPEYMRRGYVGFAIHAVCGFCSTSGSLSAVRSISCAKITLFRRARNFRKRNFINKLCTDTPNSDTFTARPPAPRPTPTRDDSRSTAPRSGIAAPPASCCGAPPPIRRAPAPSPHPCPRNPPAPRCA